MYNLTKLLVASVTSGNDKPVMSEDGKLYLQYDRIEIRVKDKPTGFFSKNKGHYFEWVLFWKNEEIQTISIPTPVYFSYGDSVALNNIYGRVAMEMDS